VDWLAVLSFSKSCEVVCMKQKSLLCASVLALSLCAAAQTTVSVAPDAASKEDVQKLFDVMASRQQITQMMQQLFAQMRSMNREQLKKRHPDLTEADQGLKPIIVARFGGTAEAVPFPVFSSQELGAKS
jgi:hypothetical protein